LRLGSQDVHQTLILVALKKVTDRCPKQFWS